MRTRSLIKLVAVCLFLFGCTSTAEQMAEKGIEPMTAAEIREAFTGNSAYIKGPDWEYTGYYNPDGTLIGRSWWQGGEETATATWEIKDDGLLCRDWDNDWGGGGYGCARMYRDGENIVYDNVSGSAGKYPSLTLTLSEGNAFNL